MYGNSFGELCNTSYGVFRAERVYKLIYISLFQIYVVVQSVLWYNLFLNWFINF